MFKRCSGGGVLTAWVVGHDDSFAAAALFALLLIGYQWLEQRIYLHGLLNGLMFRFGKIQQNWLDRSPIMRTGYIKTPTLFMTGVLDIRTPMPQTEKCMLL